MQHFVQFITAQSGGGGNLPDWWDNVALYVPADESIADESGLETVLSGNLAVTLDTTTKKYGEGSLNGIGGGTTLTMELTEDHQTSGEFTIAFWFRTTTWLGGNPVLVDMGSYAGAGTGLSILTFSDNIFVNYNNGLINTPSCSAGVWYYLTLTRDASNVVRLYRDGVFINKFAAQGGTFPDLSPSKLFSGSSGYVDSYSGNIDDLMYVKDVCLWDTETLFNVPTGPHNDPASYSDAWTPIAITTTAWYDASDEDTITSAAGKVSQWDDKSGNGLHVVQATGASQPSTGTRMMNELNVIDFDGLNHMAKTSFPVAASGDLNIFMVTEMDVLNQVNDCIVAMDGDNDFQYGAEYPPEFAGNLKVTNIGADTIIGGDKGPSIYNLTFDFSGTGKYFGYLNGTKGANEGNYTAKLSTTQKLILFANRNEASMIDGHIAEVVIIETCDATCRQYIEGYLAWKWGIQSKLPTGHPYKLARPTL